MKNLSQTQRGFSLVELMVGLALGSFVVLGALTATSGLLRGDALAAARLDQDLRNAAFVFERDVMRAGYWGSAAQGLKTGVTAYANPFADLDTDTAGCVLFSYDLNDDGALDTAGSDERYAFALSAGVLYMRTGGTESTCDVHTGTWEPVTDQGAVKVTSFDVSVANTDSAIPGSSRVIRSRSLTYTLTVVNARDASQSQSVTNTVKLPNDIVN